MDNYICFRVPFLLFINSEDHSDDSRSGFQASVVQNSERFWLLFRDGAQPINGIRFSVLFPRFDLILSLFGAVQETIGLVSRLNDVAVVRQSVEERRGHLGVTKHARPLCKRQIRGDQHAGTCGRAKAGCMCAQF